MKEEEKQMLMDLSLEKKKKRFQGDLEKQFKMIKDLVKAEEDKQCTPMRSSKHGFTMVLEWILCYLGFS